MHTHTQSDLIPSFQQFLDRLSRGKGLMTLFVREPDWTLETVLYKNNTFWKEKQEDKNNVFIPLWPQSQGGDIVSLHRYSMKQIWELRKKPRLKKKVSGWSWGPLTACHVHRLYSLYLLAAVTTWTDNNWSTRKVCENVPKGHVPSEGGKKAWELKDQLKPVTIMIPLKNQEMKGKLQCKGSVVGFWPTNSSA